MKYLKGEAMQSNRSRIRSVVVFYVLNDNSHGIFLLIDKHPSRKLTWTWSHFLSSYLDNFEQLTDSNDIPHCFILINTIRDALFAPVLGSMKRFQRFLSNLT